MKHLFIALLLAGAVWLAMVSLPPGADIGEIARGALWTLVVVTVALTCYAWLMAWWLAVYEITGLLLRGARRWADAQLYLLQRARSQWYAHLAATGRAQDEPVDDVTALALDLLRDARLVAGDDAVHIPSWRVLNEHGAALREWSGSAWQAAVDAMRDYMLIVQGGGGGTTLRPEYRDLRTFARLVETGAIKLRQDKDIE